MNPVHTATTRIQTPEEIALNAGQGFARLHPPTPQVFADRALRLRELAAGHAMRDYLMFIAQLAEAQDRALKAFPAVPLPDSDQLDAASQNGQPALPASRWPRDALWQRQLHALLDDVISRLPEDSPARQTAQAVRHMSPEMLERQADRLLAGVMMGLDFAAAPFIAAGLQTYWTHLVMATQQAHAQQGGSSSPWGYAEDATRCPCCGSLPTASIVRLGGDTDGRRYLHCSLCNTQWHMVRVKCTHCEGTQGIHYQGLQKREDAQQAEGDAPRQAAVQAETCDACGHYLKIVRMPQDPHVDPVADDLASVTLDLLVSETGMQRHGVNLMLLFGDDADDASGA